MLEFDYRNAVALDEVPVLSAEALGERILAAVHEGWRVLAYFALPEAGEDGAAGLCCVVGMFVV